MCKVCDRVIAREQKLQFWEHGYCSFYCQRFDELKLTQVPKSDSKHHNNHLMYPPIPANCETCGKEFNLHWRPQHANRAFCSQECNNHIPNRKRVRKHYFPLKVLKHASIPLIASDIAKRTDKQNKYRITSTGVAQMLLQYIKKGVVIVNETMDKGYPLRQYIMSPKYKTVPIKSYLW